DMGPYYNSLMGVIEAKSSIFIYGTSGSGKSVFVISLANFFANNFGKVLYCSHEEALKKSLRDRSNNFNIESKKLFVGENIDFSYLLEKIKRNYYRMVIIDSVQYMQFSYDQLKELNTIFKKRKLILVLVSFGTAYKKPGCNNDIMHACDVKIFFDAGVATVDSRYLSEVRKNRIFTPRTSLAVQSPTLF
ncbi:MAG: AAA family ATPase, partial [Clostridiales bacterium]|nr:AAA family ATPase [Clostridiales bacterium]